MKLGDFWQEQGKHQQPNEIHQAATSGSIENVVRLLLMTVKGSRKCLNQGGHGSTEQKWHSVERGTTW